MAVWVIEENCTGCKLCLKACPYGAVVVEDKLARITEICTNCGACLKACKFEALASDIEEEAIPDLSGYKGVWVFAETTANKLAPVTLELLGEGVRLAGEMGQDLSAVLLGNNVQGLAPELAAQGAAQVYLCQSPDLESYSTLAYTRVLAELAKKYSPSILLMGATPVGRDLAPRLSMRLGLGLTADCTELAIDKETGNLMQTRPAFGGNVMATIVTPRVRPQMATVRPGVMEKAEADPKAKARVVNVKAETEPKDLINKLLNFTPQQGKKVDLAAAKVIVAAGRGAGGKEGFALISELAGRLGAELGGTRVAVEEGWLPAERQIGQTGQSVRPELYIACGISGAIQHRAGCLGSRYIVAINNDPNAPIFKVADYAIFGDLFKVIPALLDNLKAEV